jgi:SAM-dependent methyltransferase
VFTSPTVDTGDYAYLGSELDLFALAGNWKRYWGAKVRKHLGARVLEVGAGLGATAGLLCSKNQVSWLALEPDRNLAQRIFDQRSVGIVPEMCKVLVGTISDIPASEIFDTILYIDVLEHIPDDRDELERAASHLESGGKVVVLAPAHQALYSPFDKAIGHCRRYDFARMRALAPVGLKLRQLQYLDSVGLLASLGNRVLLKSASPTEAQILLWDRWMVPISRIVDPLTGHRIGKSILAMWCKA